MGNPEHDLFFNLKCQYTSPKCVCLSIVHNSYFLTLPYFFGSFFANYCIFSFEPAAQDGVCLQTQLHPHISLNHQKLLSSYELGCFSNFLQVFKPDKILTSSIDVYLSHNSLLHHILSNHH